MRLTITQYDATNGVDVSAAAIALISIAAPGSLPVRLGLSLTLDWGGGQQVSPGVYLFTATSPYPWTISSLDAGIGSAGGTITATVRNAGATVGGLTAIAISQTAKTNFVASGAAAIVAAGAMLDVLISITGSPADSYLTLNGAKL